MAVLERTLHRAGIGLVVVACLASVGCGGDSRQFARVFQIETMSQTIGGPSAGARPGDFLLENERIRAVIHGRHNNRSMSPVSNGSLIDLDIQRPAHRYGVGRGRDAFFELGPMANLKVNNAKEMGFGPCDTVGDAPCPDGNRACVRVTARGRGEDIIGILGLLDLAIKRDYENSKMVMVNDYDLCPGESFVRVTTTAFFDDDKTTKLEAEPMEDLKQRTGLLDVILGETTGQDCAKDKCPTGEDCIDLLLPLAVGGFNMEMKRCRKPEHKSSGVVAGDLALFSGKGNIFIPGMGFDHDGSLRSVFDTGGDVFTYPLSVRMIASVADDVSYTYFTAGGEMMIPVFTESFTFAMTSRFACPASKPDCIKGKKLRFSRYVSVGHGDVASALEGFYKMQKIPFGRLEGNVIDVRTRKPLSGINVFVFKTPEAWRDLKAEQVAARSFEDLVAAHKKETKSAENPDGALGIVSHLKTDTGLDQVKDGSFAGPVAVGGPAAVSCTAARCRYILVAQGEGRPISRLAVVHVSRGQTTRATVVASEGATLQFDVRDPSGRYLPCKLTIGHCFSECAHNEDCRDSKNPICNKATRLCMPSGGYTGPGSCRPDQVWDGGAQTCRCRDEAFLPIALGGHRYADGTVHVYHSSSGKSQIPIEPGVFEVIISRGFEYEISRHFVSLEPGVIRRIEAVLPRVVDTAGWISADFHVHGPNSPDGSVMYAPRVKTFVAEGVELLSSSEHDHLTDYSPYIYELGVQDWVKSQVGLEVSPIDYGHFIGFPLRYDENADLNGAFYWRETVPRNPGSDLPDWDNMVPSKIYKKLREIGALGAERTVVVVAHFYDHFTFYDLNPFTMELPGFSLTSLFNPVLQSSKFSGNFDALEAFNGKGQDMLRRPTYAEISDYNIKLNQAVAQSKDLGYEERQKLYGNLTAEAQRNFLERTPEEQKLAIAYSNPSFQCRCTADADCGIGFLCDADTGACASSCTSDSHCDEELVTAGREACRQKGTESGRMTCQRLPQSCTQDTDCVVEWTGGVKESCVKGACQLTCSVDGDCKDAKRPVCADPGQGQKICTGVAKASPKDPCITVRGTLDDWFQLLNRGVFRPILGNSDTHGTYSTEAGIPRNYVRSSTDLPQQISSGEVADNVRAMLTFPTYGPFVELTLDGQPMGSRVKAKKGQPVTLKLRVQSPLWFDVDRIEIYRNGELIKEVTGSTTCKPGSDSCIRVPNDRVINFDAKINDTPERDAWYAAAVMGLDGKLLAPIYSSKPVGRLGIFELIQRLTPLLPPLRSFRTPLSPSQTKVRPYAITNPIWVDLDGDGITPVATMPGWATDKDIAGVKSSALTSSTHNHTHTHSDGEVVGHVHSDQGEHAHRAPPAHDHRVGLGRMRIDTQSLMKLVREGVITKEVVQKALDQLRYLGM